MSLDLIRSYTLTDGKHVGDLLWWTLTDARVTRSLLESIWASAGLSASWLPEPPTPEKGLKTAIRESQVGQHQHLLRLGKEDEHEIIFAVLLETRDSTGNVSLTQEARVRLDRRAPAKLDSDQAGHDLVVAISAAYDRLLTAHTADDVRRAIVKTLSSCAAVTLRDHGGVYWVPAPRSPDIVRLLANPSTSLNTSMSTDRHAGKRSNPCITVEWVGAPRWITRRQSGGGRHALSSRNRFAGPCSECDLTEVSRASVSQGWQAEVQPGTVARAGSFCRSPP